jgi:hypothetical protein
MSELNPKTAGVVDLTYCVATVQSLMEDYSDRLQEKLTQLAIRGLTNLNVFNSLQIECEYLEMDSNGVVDLSEITDFVDFIKVGIPVNGKLWVLNINDKILPRRNALSADQAALIYNGDSGDINVTDGYYFGSPTNGLFGLSGGFSRSYVTYDEELRVLQFDSVIPRSQILLEYVSTGVKASGHTTIPRYLVEYIVAYINWQLIILDPRVDRFEKRERKTEFLEQEKILQRYKTKFNLSDYFAATYSTYKQTPKR